MTLSTPVVTPTEKGGALMFRARDKQKEWTTAWRLFVHRKNRKFLAVLEEFIDQHFDRKCPMEVWITIQRTIGSDTEVIEQKGWFLPVYLPKDCSLCFYRSTRDELINLELNDYVQGDPFAIVRITKIGPEKVWLITLVKNYQEKDILAMGYRRNEEGDFDPIDSDDYSEFDCGSEIFDDDYQDTEEDLTITGELEEEALTSEKQ